MLEILQSYYILLIIAIKSHFESSELYMNHRYIVLPSTVVVGRTRSVPHLYIAFQAKVCAAPLSFILILSVCPFIGVPVGAPNVAPTASAVTVNKSDVVHTGVGVALDVMVVTLGAILQRPLTWKFPVPPFMRYPVEVAD